MTRRDAEEMFDLLGNGLAREILVRTSDRPRSATELAADCDVSKPTVYRRLEALEGHSLVEKRTRYDEDGNHYATYECRVETVTFDVGGDGVTVELDLHSPVDDD